MIFNRSRVIVPITNRTIKYFAYSNSQTLPYIHQIPLFLRSRRYATLSKADSSIPITGPQPNRNRLKILFFGSDDFAVKHLRALVEERDRPDSVIESIEVVSPADYTKQRSRKQWDIFPMPTKAFSLLRDLHVFELAPKIKNLDEWKLPISHAHPDSPYDLGIVVSFGHFIPPRIISSFTKGAINVHPSLLPKYRGASPVQYTILNDDSETGVTIQSLHDKVFDAGDILKQEKMMVPTDGVVTFKMLMKELGDLGARILVQTLRDFDKLKADSKTQDISQVFKAPKITKEMSAIDWDTMTAADVERRHRAIGHQVPLTTIFTLSRIKRSKKVKQKHITFQLSNIYIPLNSPAYNVVPFPSPGTIFYDGVTDTMHVVCSDGNVVGLTHLKADNKKIIKCYDFFNGYLVKSGDVKFGIYEGPVEPGMSAVKITKRREEYNKTLKRQEAKREKFDKIARRHLALREREMAKTKSLGRNENWDENQRMKARSFEQNEEEDSRRMTKAKSFGQNEEENWDEGRMMAKTKPFQRNENLDKEKSIAKVRSLGQNRENIWMKGGE